MNKNSFNTRVWVRGKKIEMSRMLILQRIDYGQERKPNPQICYGVRKQTWGFGLIVTRNSSIYRSEQAVPANLVPGVCRVWVERHPDEYRFSYDVIFGHKPPETRIE